MDLSRHLTDRFPYKGYPYQEEKPKILRMLSLSRKIDLIQVLLVEDNPGDRLLIREMLADSEFSDFTVTPVATLSEAIVSVSQAQFDVALLDLSLPDSSGVDTIIRLRNNAKYFPIIILTGLEDHETAFGALELGAQDFLSKNRLDTFSLERSINYAVSRKKLEDQNRLQAAALQSAANAVFITDKNGIIEWVNPAFTKINGLSARRDHWTAAFDVQRG